MATFRWERNAFRHEGRCDICETWTRSGVTKAVRFNHLCEDCARNKFPGEIVMGFATPQDEGAEEGA